MSVFVFIFEKCDVFKRETETENEAFPHSFKQNNQIELRLFFSDRKNVSGGVKVKNLGKFQFLQ